MLAFFYEPTIHTDSPHITLSEETSKHCIQVLRMKTGEELLLTNGKGLQCQATIVSEDKKKAVVLVHTAKQVAAPTEKISIAISLLKNVTRLEWFLEKATEIGVTDIQPLICARTEHHRFKTERMQGILASAMLQSQQCWLPVLHEPVAVQQLVSTSRWPQKLVAHCEEDAGKQEIIRMQYSRETQLLVGPEGDFTPDEIALAKAHGFVPVGLGNTRLRTETAGMVAAVLLTGRRSV
ncbi:RsmE family RNA methyltransferase [Sediminibacterium soli]|uniref:RsmE family RNA methyltransferase n=1 Tax=Sediminibacterium soli TaxID=2698829 RepID=UPI00137B4AC0|nr:RsmE family RNA methyltransferase [Sediminibacterium soli]NCI45460.1 16S rRNA (uracil(1498)-N(3))-methyltransferase [Sediminibacterium soli]